MLRFVLGRLVYGAAALWITATLTFVLMHHLPGEPFTSGKMIGAPVMKNLRVKYGLDKPLVEQYAVYMKNVLRGDLGVSMVYANRSVNGIIGRTFPVTADIGVKAVLMAVLIGIPLGIGAALYRKSWLDWTAILFIMAGISIPGFIFGTLVQYGLCYRLSSYIQGLTGMRLLPVTGWGTFGHTVAPAITLALGAGAMVARMMRTSMLKVLEEDYITGAKAKGMRHREIICGHALKNAVLPVVSILGTVVSTVFLGSFAVESIFAVPGLGQYFVSSIQSKDYTMIMGLAMFAVFITVAANTLTDILYGLLDPRVKFAGWRR